MHATRVKRAKTACRMALHVWLQNRTGASVGAGRASGESSGGTSGAELPAPPHSDIFPSPSSRGRSSREVAKGAGARGPGSLLKLAGEVIAACSCGKASNHKRGRIKKNKVPREKRATGRAVAYIAAVQELMDILACCWQNAYLAATAGVAADPPAWCAKTRSRVLALVFGAAASRAPLPSASPVQCIADVLGPCDTTRESNCRREIKSGCFPKRDVSRKCNNKYHDNGRSSKARHWHQISTREREDTQEGTHRQRSAVCGAAAASLCLTDTVRRVTGRGVSNSQPHGLYS